MMQILDAEKVERLAPILRLAFRPLFLLGGLFSCIAILLWGAALSGSIEFAPYGNILFWHSHEMLFGFVSAIIVGFLLTAVQNWTGLPSIRGKKLVILTSLWLAARAAMLFSVSPSWLVIAIDLLFLPLSGYWLAKPIIATGQMRNLFFVPILVLLSAMNLIMHLGIVLAMPSLYQHGFLSAIWLITLLMSVLGGRVIPFFTANGTKTRKVEPLPWLENATLGSTWCIFAVYVSGLIYYMPNWLIASLLLACSLLQAIRVGRWKIQQTLSVPLLWSLHVAYWFIPIGIGLIGISYLSDQITLSTAFHTLTVGAMGNMILSMMARVSLGHTGRQLMVKSMIIAAFAAILVAALIRVFAIIFYPELSFSFIVISMIAWCVAYGLFTLIYFPVLTQSRADGRPG